MNNLSRLCLDFSNDVFQTCLEIESHNIQLSHYVIPEVLKQTLLSTKKVFFDAVEGEKCETNMKYMELLESIIVNVQDIVYWFGLLDNQQLINQQDFEDLQKQAEEIMFIAKSTIKKIEEHIEACMFEHSVMNDQYQIIDN